MDATGHGAAPAGSPPDDAVPAGAIAWIDGRFVPAAHASIPVGDAGFVLGTTVTEQLRTFNGGLFKPAEHAARFAQIGRAHV